MTLPRLLIVIALWPAHALCAQTETVVEIGGPARVQTDGKNAFSFPARVLNALERRRFMAGNALFKTNWVPAPASAQSRDGLGPLFDARSCSSCHAFDGRGRPPEPLEEGPTGLLLRLGVSGPTGDRPHPIYGDQLQPRAILGIAGEARFEIVYETVHTEARDGTRFALQRPRYRLLDWADGEPGPDLRIGPRVAQSLIGLGLLESVPETVILEREDPTDRDGDGISGRAHWITDPSSPSRRLGRFGWKATQASVREQTAAALSGDMGLTTSLHPAENVTTAQRERIPLNAAQPEIDVSDDQLALLTFYTAMLAVPDRRGARDPVVLAGERLFQEIGCAACHYPELRTGPDAIHPGYANQRFRPYTDLLLHDLGPGLADEKRDGEALPSEWRTAPLWGLGLQVAVSGHERLLHDGRARNIEEAILWHGGEALAAQRAYLQLPASGRSALLAFLRSL